jgi:hypothetical protein
MRPSAQEILQDLRRVHSELGKVPSRTEYNKHGKIPSLTIIEVFGSYHLMVKLSGLEYSAKGKRDKEQIRKEAFEHLKKEIEQKKSTIIEPPKLYHRVLCIGDLHAPYNHEDAIQWLIALNRKYLFDKVIFIGDEIDLHSVSFHSHDPDLLSPGHELEAAIKILEPLYKEFPKADVAESNHGSLLLRKAKHFGLPVRAIKSYQEILQSPKEWKWHYEIKLQLSNGQRLLAHHSYGSNILLASQRRGENLISGHVHNKFSLEHWSNEERTFFAGQTGCLIDDTSMAMAYNKNTVQRPMLGSIAILDGIPKLLPMHVDRKNRWNGVIP